MSTIAFDRAGRRQPESQRFRTALLLSVIAHLLIFGLLIRLPRPVPLSFPVTFGQSFALQAILNGQIAPAPTPEPEPELVSEPQVPELTQPATTQAPAIVPPVKNESSFGRRQGPVTQNADADNAIPVRGRVTMGVLKNAKELGDLTAIKLAVRFPTAASSPPVLRGSLSVIYPPEALLASVGMRIAAVVVVNDSGNIVEVTTSPPDPWFGPAIMNAIAGAKFTPARIDGQRVTYWTILDFEFTIDKP
jgi:outer membrane biosynthesis protein TonB